MEVTNIDEENGNEDVGDFVFEGEDLTRAAVDEACGASESAYATRGSTLRNETPGTSRNNRGKNIQTSTTSTRVQSNRVMLRVMLIDEDDEDMEEDIGLSEDDGEDVVLGIDEDDQDDDLDF